MIVVLLVVKIYNIFDSKENISMKITWQKKQNRERLIIFFNGWGCDEKPFTQLQFGNYDFLMCNNYLQTNSIPLELIDEIKAYKEVNLIAWSMGVCIANSLFQCTDIIFNNKVAINGTLLPIDDLNGIPENIYNGTLENLNEQTINKFFLRMCGDKATFTQFIINQPDRLINNQIMELYDIQKLVRFNITEGFKHI